MLSWRITPERRTTTGATSTEGGRRTQDGRAGELDRELYAAVPAGYYDHAYARGRGVQWFWHHHRFARVDAALPPRLDRILDLGCGPGTYLGRLALPFAYGLGIDLAVAQIAYARRRHGRPGLEFRAADVTALERLDPFDAVVCIELIEHLPPADTVTLLSCAYDLLRPGGSLVLTTPNFRSGWPLIEWAVSRVGAVDYRAQHINRFDTRRLRAAAAEAGFVDLRIETFYLAAPFVAAVSRRLAERALRWERPWASRWGYEILLSARRPSVDAAAAAGAVAVTSTSSSR